MKKKKIYLSKNKRRMIEKLKEINDNPNTEEKVNDLDKKIKIKKSGIY